MTYLYYPTEFEKFLDSIQTRIKPEIEMRDVSFDSSAMLFHRRIFLLDRRDQIGSYSRTLEEDSVYIVGKEKDLSDELITELTRNQELTTAEYLDINDCSLEIVHRDIVYLEEGEYSLQNDRATLKKKLPEFINGQIDLAIRNSI